jgi:hypothetical protein
MHAADQQQRTPTTAKYLVLDDGRVVAVPVRYER